jgi:peptide/nickel transport system ATP-binding protein
LPPATAVPRPSVVPSGLPSTNPLPDGGASKSNPPPPQRGDVILDVRDLCTYFYTYDGVVRALDGVSFKVRRGETVGMAGETGCGKSVTMFSALRLIPDPPGRTVSGKVLFQGANLLWGIESEARMKPIGTTGRVKVSRKFRRIKAANERMSAVRGHGISMIFQEPTSAMNPLFPVYDQIGETLLLHRGSQILDSLLKATPSAPGVRPALERLAETVERRAEIPEIRARAKDVAEAVGCSSAETQLFYRARDARQNPARILHQLERSLQRFHLRGPQRSYLRHQLNLIRSQERLKQIYMGEMRTGKLDRTGKINIRNRMRLQRWSHFYFGLWGVRGRVSKPLKDELFWQTVHLLEGVQIANPVQVARGYPFELSGGMLQRVMIAMALSSEPLLLMADEPTTALDVTIQAQILDLMRDLKQRVGMGILLVTHDLAVIAEVADRVCIMYAGQIVENAPVKDLFAHPLHPYTQGLLSSIPRMDQPDKRLDSIPGSVPNLISPPSGCRFHPRCPYAMEICKKSRPPMTDEGNQHHVACFLYHGPPVSE